MPVHDGLSMRLQALSELAAALQKLRAEPGEPAAGTPAGSGAASPAGTLSPVRIWAPAGDAGRPWLKPVIPPLPLPGALGLQEPGAGAGASGAAGARGAGGGAMAEGVAEGPASARAPRRGGPAAGAGASWRAWRAEGAGTSAPASPRGSSLDFLPAKAAGRAKARRDAAKSKRDAAAAELGGPGADAPGPSPASAPEPAPWLWQAQPAPPRPSAFAASVVDADIFFDADSAPAGAPGAAERAGSAALTLYASAASDALPADLDLAGFPDMAAEPGAAGATGAGSLPAEEAADAAAPARTHAPPPEEAIPSDALYGSPAALLSGKRAWQPSPAAERGAPAAAAPSLPPSDAAAGGRGKEGSGPQGSEQPAAGAAAQAAAVEPAGSHAAQPAEAEQSGAAAGGTAADARLAAAEPDSSSGRAPAEATASEPAAQALEAGADGRAAGSGSGSAALKRQGGFGPRRSMEAAAAALGGALGWGVWRARPHTPAQAGAKPKHSPAPATADGLAAVAAVRSAAPQLGAEQGQVATLNRDPSAAHEQAGGSGATADAAARVAVGREGRPSAQGLGSGTRMHALGKENVDTSSEGGDLGHKPADHAASKAASDAALAGAGAGATGVPDQAQAHGQATPVPDQALVLGRAAPAPQAAGAGHSTPAGDAPAVMARSQTSSTRGFARLPGEGGARAPAQLRAEHCMGVLKLPVLGVFKWAVQGAYCRSRGRVRGQ